MSTLPSPVHQRAADTGRTAADVASANFGRCEFVTQIDRDSLRQGFGNLNAEGRDLSGGSRTGARADPFSPERTRSGFADMVPEDPHVLYETARVLRL